MIAELKLPQEEFEEIFKNLRKVFGSSEDSPPDLNIIISPKNIKIYSTIPNTHAAVHELEEDDDKVTTNRTAELSFNPAVLSQIVSEAGDNEISLKIFNNRYLVESEAEGFTSRITFSLYQHVESVFQPLIQPEDIQMITTFDRFTLLKSLNMMDALSETITVGIKDGELSFAVSDQVKGEGEVRREIESQSLPEGLHDYNLAILGDFLSSLDTANVELGKNQSGNLVLESSSDLKSSKLYLSPRKP